MFSAWYVSWQTDFRNVLAKQWRVALSRNQKLEVAV